MQLLLIRHATNDWVGDRLAGWQPGVCLNDAGRAEAAALAARLASYPLETVYASPLERAQETAAFVAGPHGLSVETHDGLGEVRYGDWTGKRLKDLRHDPLWHAVQTNPSGVRFPGGETIAEVQARVVATIESLRERHPDGVVAAVSHGDVVRVAVAHYAGMHIDLFQRLVVGTASVTVLRFTPHGPRLFSFNDKGSVPPPPKQNEATDTGDQTEATDTGDHPDATDTGDHAGATDTGDQTEAHEPADANNQPDRHEPNTASRGNDGR